MTVKRKYAKWYWATEQPRQERKIVVRYQPIKSGAGTKGEQLGNLDSPTHITIDAKEDDEGWVRIMSVDGHSPVPSSWAEFFGDEDEVNWEWWIDKGAVMPELEDGSAIELDIQFPGKIKRHIVLHEAEPDQIFKVR